MCPCVRAEQFKLHGSVLAEPVRRAAREAPSRLGRGVSKQVGLFEARAAASIYIFIDVETLITRIKRNFKNAFYEHILVAHKNAENIKKFKNTFL